MVAATVFTGAEAGAGAADVTELARVIPVQRLNSILVVTPRAHYLKAIETWIDRLDGEPNAMFTKRLYVYPVQNTTAERLADLLTNIYSGGGGGDTGGDTGGDNASSDATGMVDYTIHFKPDPSALRNGMRPIC